MSLNKIGKIAKFNLILNWIKYIGGAKFGLNWYNLIYKVQFD